MKDITLELDHKTFRFEVIEGTVKDTNLWTETDTITDAQNARGTTSVRSKKENKREFWLETKTGDEYYFIVNASRVPLSKNEKIKLLITAGGKTEAVLVYNKKQKELFTNVTIFGLVFNEAPLLNMLLIIASVIGIFFALGPALMTAIYTGLILFTAMRWFTRLGFYKKRLEGIKTRHFE